jgi:CHAT domain-containing protein
VLASLWQVDDRSTALLMEELHRHLRAGASKSEALRQAALRLLRGPAATLPKADSVAGIARADFTDPYYWAPFVLSGDW